MIMLLTHRVDLRQDLTTVLRQKGSEVCCAEHRQDVSGIIEKCRPTILVLDLYMADPSGLELLRNVRASGYRGKVILLSGNSMVRVVNTAYAYGVDRVVSVPDATGGTFRFDELVAAIHSCAVSAV